MQTTNESAHEMSGEQAREKAALHLGNAFIANERGDESGYEMGMRLAGCYQELAVHLD